MATGDKLVNLDSLKTAYDTSAKFTAPMEASSTASAAHATGEYFIFNGLLYVATSDIASGATITPNTNCRAVPGGIGGDVGVLKSALELSTGNMPYSFSKGYYINTSGDTTDFTPVQNDQYEYAIINCNAGDKFEISLRGGTAPRAYAFADNNTPANIFQSPKAWAEWNTTAIITAPTGATKLILNNNKAKDGWAIKNIPLVERVNDCESSIATLNPIKDDIIPLKNIPDGFSLLKGKWRRGNIDANGNYNSSITYRVCSDGFVIFDRDAIVQAKKGYSIRRIVYDDNSVLFSDYTTSGITKFTIPRGSKCQFNILKDGVSSGNANIEEYSQAAFVSYYDNYNLVDPTAITAYGNATFSLTSGFLKISVPSSSDYSNGVFIPLTLDEGDMVRLNVLTNGTRDANMTVQLALTGENQNPYDGIIQTVLPARNTKVGQFAIAKANCTGAILAIKCSYARTFIFSELQITKVSANIDYPTPSNSFIDSFARAKANQNSERIGLSEKFDVANFAKHQMRKPMVTIIDDDGNYEFYNYLLPMINDYHVPIATAYMGNNNFREPGMYMSVDQLNAVVAAGGEVIGHTTGNLAEVTIAEAEARIIKFKRMMEANGFYTNLFVYPEGGNNEAVRAMMTKYFSGAFITSDNSDINDRTNSGCIANYRIKRCHCGGAGYDPISTTGRYANLDTSKMEYFEELVAEAVEKNSWLVLYTHSFQMANGQQPTDGVTQFQRMREIIEYIISQGVDIVKAEDAFLVFGNAIQCGDYLGDHNDDMTLHTKKGCAINKLGEIDFPSA